MEVLALPDPSGGGDFGLELAFLGQPGERRRHLGAADVAIPDRPDDLRREGEDLLFEPGGVDPGARHGREAAERAVAGAHGEQEEQRAGDERRHDRDAQPARQLRRRGVRRRSLALESEVGGEDEALSRGERSQLPGDREARGRAPLRRQREAHDEALDDAVTVGESELMVELVGALAGLPERAGDPVVEPVVELGGGELRIGGAAAPPAQRVGRGPGVAVDLVETALLELDCRCLAGRAARFDPG